MTGHLRIELTDELIERTLARRAGSRAPEDIVEAIISSAATTPQRRGHIVPALPGIARSRAAWLMVGTVLALLAIGAAIVVGSYLKRQPTTVDSGMLITKWTSVGDRAFPGFPADAFADLTIDATTLSMNGWKGPIDSSWSLTAPDRHLVVTMRATQANLTMQRFDCRPGQEGSYTVGLSSDRQTMTLTPVREACSGRADILAGDWTRWPCPNPDSVCAPELEPGLHHSSFAQYGDPYSPASSPPALNGYSYIVPAGWSSLENSLARPNDPGTMAIRLALDVAPHSQAANCPDAVEPGVGSSPTDLATWLQGLPGLVTTTPTPVTIGGHSGLLMDVSVAPAWRLACQQDPPGVVYTFRDPVDSLRGNAHSRFILLEFGAAHTLLIEISAPDEASWNDLVQAAMPIVETFQFTR